MTNRNIGNRRVSLVAFDMGGVMVRTNESIPIAEYARISGKSEQEVFAAIFSPKKKRLIETGEITPADHARNANESLNMDLSQQEFWRIHLTSHTPDIAVGEIVESTAAQVRVAIASNLPRPHWEWANENLPFSSQFDPAVLSFEIGAMKPDSDYFRALIRMSKGKPEELFFTDDNKQNVEAAARKGVRAYLFQGAGQLREDLRANGIRA